MMMAKTKPIILFDGVCVLCSAGAAFVLRHDRRAVFRLAAMQGTFGTDLCQQLGIDPDNPATIVLLEGDRVHTESDAIIAICHGLAWPWKAAVLLKVLPRGLRNAVYRRIARHRYRLFGKRYTCFLPSADQASRVL
jgi:predicted DCC family thiol-disulfide oxidoreductase YuxK